MYCTVLSHIYSINVMRIDFSSYIIIVLIDDQEDQIGARVGDMNYQNFLEWNCFWITENHRGFGKKNHQSTKSYWSYLSVGSLGSLKLLSMEQFYIYVCKPHSEKFHSNLIEGSLTHDKCVCVRLVLFLMLLGLYQFFRNIHSLREEFFPQIEIRKQ